MFLRLGRLVSRHWLKIIIGWVLFVALLRWWAPPWDEVTRDGDLAYLPEVMPSVVGERLLSEAFSHTHARSQVVFFVARDDRPLDNDDRLVAYDLARRLQNLYGAHALAESAHAADEARRLRAEGKTDEADRAGGRSEASLAKAKVALDEAIRLDRVLASYWDNKESQAEDRGHQLQRPPRLAAAYFNRALLHRRSGLEEEASADRQVAVDLDPSLADCQADCLPEIAATIPILDVWTWLDRIFGKKLYTRRAWLIVVQLSNEFMATGNIRVLDCLEAELEEVRRTLPDAQADALQLGLSGSAAIGGDLLRAAKESLKNTELFTVVLVVVILGFVYRSPLLVLMPLVTITVSLVAATSIVALLTQLGALPGFAWWDFKVFTTTKIFIVVILFGAGTDYFLFLVARYREELELGHAGPDAIARALAAVGDALAASALTTILGLATMFFADFGKFKNSGPAIGLCLAITLLACVTLAPALLRAFGRAVFWPFGPQPRRPRPATALQSEAAVGGGRFGWLWERLAHGITAHPGLILTISLLVLAGPACYGIHTGRHVTYDFLRQLPPHRPSRQGAEVMARHFPVGETGPLTLVAYQPDGAFDTVPGRQRIRELTRALYYPDLRYHEGVKRREGVLSVRSVTDPLGDFPPGKKLRVLDRQSWAKWVTSPHARTQEFYVAAEGRLAGHVTRFDLILKYDPFSIESERVLTALEEDVRRLSQSRDSGWYGAQFAFSGTTAGIRDLKMVTQSDNTRIECLVVLAVLAVLLAILRRPLICLYMVATVLLSYFVAIGITEWFFARVYGPEFLGLDWKVPLFLFVILVAIGEDYNVYLATRVLEEQRRRGAREGLRYAVIRTGGIITSCGVIMAGTFSAMTSGTWGRVLPSWLPWADRLFAAPTGALPAIVELGFALSLGVMLDTFIVRPVLVPALFALLCRREERGPDAPTGRSRRLPNRRRGTLRPKCVPDGAAPLRTKGVRNERATNPDGPDRATKSPDEPFSDE